jgi:hypothetical protein
MCGRICNGCDVAVVRAECICVAVYATVVVLLLSLFSFISFN